MNWIPLQSDKQLNEIREKSTLRPQVIYKHSTRCATSQLVRSRLERTEAPQDIDFYFLDLIAHRSLSDKIAEDFDVWHESPQILVIRNGKSVYDDSHLGISMKDILAHSV
jgi:bacillithiol system protein YtxJ